MINKNQSTSNPIPTISTDPNDNDDLAAAKWTTNQRLAEWILNQLTQPSQDDDYDTLQNYDQNENQVAAAGIDADENEVFRAACLAENHPGIALPLAAIGGGTNSNSWVSDLTTATCTISSTCSNTPTSEKWDVFQAKRYYEGLNKNYPKYLMAMAFDVINPLNGCHFSNEEEPFASYHKRNKFNVGCKHFWCKVTCWLHIDPSWVWVRIADCNMPKIKDWQKKNKTSWMVS